MIEWTLFNFYSPPNRSERQSELEVCELSKIWLLKLIWRTITRGCVLVTVTKPPRIRPLAVSCGFTVVPFWTCTVPPGGRVTGFVATL